MVHSVGVFKDLCGKIGLWQLVDGKPAICLCPRRASDSDAENERHNSANSAVESQGYLHTRVDRNQLKECAMRMPTSELALDAAHSMQFRP